MKMRDHSKGGERMESRDHERDVEIRLHSSIRHPEQEQETHEMSLAGQLIQKNGTSYLKYEELQNGDRIRTTVKLGAEEAVILRSGAVKMRLPFSKDGERAGTYGSGPAAFGLLVKTNELSYTAEQDDSGGRFNVHYELHAEGSLLGTYELTITYTEGTQ